MIKKGILIFLFLFLLVQNTYSISVSPGKTIVFFTGSSLKEDLTISLKNTHNFDLIGELYLQTKNFPLEYVNFQTTNITFAPGERKDINFTINIPNEFDEPGDYRFDFIARELVPNERKGEGTFSISIAVGGIFIVRVPFEGYFLGARLNSKSVSSGEIVPFILTLENLGTLPINNIQGILEIFDESNNPIEKIPFIQSISTNSIKYVDLSWDSSGNSFGNYRAKAILNFEGKTIIAEDNFRLGDIFVSIIDFDKSIKSGVINKFKSEVKSEWGNSLDDVLVILEISSDESTTIHRSETFELGPFESRQVTIFVDAEEIKKGIYPAKLSVVYQGIYNVEELDLKVESFEFTVIIIGVSIFIIVFGVGYLIIRNRKKRR